MKLTDKVVKRLASEPPTKGNVITWDSEIKGFGVRVTAQGAVSFVLDYRISRRQRRYTIGRYPEMTTSVARDGSMTVHGVDGAIELLKQIRSGKDPLTARRTLRNEPTLDDLINAYLEDKEMAKNRPSTLRDYKRMADRIIRPELGNLRLNAVNRHDIAALHASLKETPYQANRVLGLLSVMFNYALREEWVQQNPVKGIERYEEPKRDRWLKLDEIARFTAALDAYHDQNAANALRLLLLTGSRAGEVLKAEWQQFDLERGVWTKPSSHTKQKKTTYIPLSPPALDMLRSMKPHHHATGPLFPGRDGKKPRAGIKRPWLQACKAAGLVTVEVVKGKRRHEVRKYKPTVRLHDLRHTFASHLVSKGRSLQIVGRLLGHTQLTTTQRYGHLQHDDLRDATTDYAEMIPFERKRA